MRIIYYDYCLEAVAYYGQTADKELSLIESALTACESRGRIESTASDQCILQQLLMPTTIRIRLMKK